MEPTSAIIVTIIFPAKVSSNAWSGYNGTKLKFYILRNKIRICNIQRWKNEISARNRMVFNLQGMSLLLLYEPKSQQEETQIKGKEERKFKLQTTTVGRMRRDKNYYRNARGKIIKYARVRF